MGVSRQFVARFQPVSEQGAGTEDAEADEDGEAEHGVGRARAPIECDPGADHGYGKTDEESDEQIGGHLQPVLGRRRFEY